jgi:serine/threonine protein kinase
VSNKSAGPPAPGELVGGKYRVERLLGQGGMGTVLAARHEQLGHRVAIKLPARGSAAAIARFLREARAAAAIESEHVARVFDAGERAPGEPYLVMERLDGDDLAAILRERGPAAPEQAVTWILQAGVGLAAAHARGIVHRDLKPANLFLARRADGTSAVKILDFGISKLRSEGGAGEDETLTQTGQIVGSPRYMAPEQIDGAPGVDERADLWALGVILHELLCGAPPFEGRSFGELRRRITSQPPRSVRLDRPEISADLEAVILRCLDREPARRFADVADLLAALAPFGPPEAPRYVERARAELSHRTFAEGPAAPTMPGTPGPDRLDTATNTIRDQAAGEPTETSPPLTATDRIQNVGQPPSPGAVAPSRGRRWDLRAGAAFALVVGAGLAAAALRSRPHGPDGPPAPAVTAPATAVEGAAELESAARKRAAGDRAGAATVLRAVVDQALASRVAPGSPRAKVAAAAALGLADIAAEELVAPPPAGSLETYLEPSDALARKTQEGMRLYGAVIPWHDAAAMQCAIVGQGRLHERQADLLLALPAPPPRSGPHERGAWSPEAALSTYKEYAESSLETALDMYDNAAARPVPEGGCRDEASRGRARVSARLGK